MSHGGTSNGGDLPFKDTRENENGSNDCRKLIILKLFDLPMMRLHAADAYVDSDTQKPRCPVSGVMERGKSARCEEPRCPVPRCERMMWLDSIHHPMNKEKPLSGSLLPAEVRGRSSAKSILKMKSHFVKNVNLPG